MTFTGAKFSGQGDDFTISGTIQLSDEAKPLPCPFCESAAIAFEEYEDVSSAFYCKDCFASGPTAFSRDKARELWNTRVPPILDLVARVSGNTIELSGVPQVTDLLSISWELVGEVDNA